MKAYSPRRRRPWRVVASTLRSFAGLLEQWPLFLLAAFLLSPVGPHLRVQTSYVQHGNYREMRACQYLGSRGWVNTVPGERCPLVAIIDRRVIDPPPSNP